MARGKLERAPSGELFLVQTDTSNCDRLCHDDIDRLKSQDRKTNVTALWLVEKIRHRDEARGHRYEIRITIIPVGGEGENDDIEGISDRERNRRSGKKMHYNNRRSFILRDADYPRYFIQTNSITSSPPALKRATTVDRSVFDFTDLYRPQNQMTINYTPELNLGEYYVKPTTDMLPPKTQSYTSRPRYSTQLFSPNFNHYTPEGTNNFRFPDNHNNNGFSNKILTEISNFNHGANFNHILPEQPAVTTHLHHHYYLDKYKRPLIKVSAYENEEEFKHPPPPIPTHKYYNNLRIETPGLESYKTEGHISTQNLYQHRPIYKIPKVEYNNYQTPQVFTNQIPIPPDVGSQIYSPHTVPYQEVSEQYHKTPVTTAQYTQTLQVPPFAGITNHRPLVKYVTQEITPGYKIIQKSRPIITPPPTSSPFKESEQLENTKYSDPDPLYHPNGINPTIVSYGTASGGDNLDDDSFKHSLPMPQQQTEPIPTTHNYIIPETAQDEDSHNYDYENSDNDRIHLHIRDQSSTHRPPSGNKYPDSINAQLPPPHPNDDTEIPYVETSVITEKSVSPPLIIVPAISAATKETITNQTKSKHRSRSPTLRKSRTTTTTEKPVLKWTPKRSRVKNASPATAATRNKSTKIYSSKIPQFDSSRVEQLITVSPLTDETPQSSTTSTTTTQPTYIEHLPKNRIRNYESQKRHDQSNSETQITGQKQLPHTEKSQTSSVSIKFANKRQKLFDAKQRPQLKLRSSKYEMIKADIQALKTNSTGMQLYRATASDDGIENRELNDGELDPIAQSILNHAKSIQRRHEEKFRK